ncbi:MAG: isoprenyl transferase [Melioribacteraceae bacterium]|nr:isoprenyl transferase [Melioribacteraceae bacterium]MCF8354932.1 isoprenyl transferase [Melioribacteraceae bacterium]MCF8392379.1 isoprenyl transferase [Melioribacteraceae bacterium]MCF8417899.1 isoprenyl transferase [Melioribacteraceae bacterium]
MLRKLSETNLSNINDVKTKGNVPSHIAIIMDGNGRWARKRGLPRVAGHQRGIETVREIVESCANLGVNFLTLYTFSTENWKRPRHEVSTLMRLIVRSLQSETDELHKNNIRLTAIGNIDILPEPVKKELKDAFDKTAGNDKMVLNLALSYSGRLELIEAVKNITQLHSEGKIKTEDITEELISENLYTKDMPDPDLLIRSGGEYRISNFLLWQIAYSELYVTDTLWPDFSCNHLLEAITDYQRRERRFGLVSEQISNNKTDHDKKLSNQVADF